MVEIKIRKIERDEIILCKTCNNAIPKDLLEKSAGGIKNLYCQYCGVSLNITYDPIDNNVIGESPIISSNIQKESNLVNIQQNSQESDLALSYSNIRNALRSHFFQLIYQLLKSTPLTQRKIQNKKELKSSHINIILKKLWKELKDLKSNDLANQELVSSKRRIKEYFEKFQSSLRPYKKFRKINFALFAENIEFVFGLILGDYEFSNLTTSKKRSVLDLKKNFGFKSDTATTNSFTYNISLIVSKKIRSIFSQYRITEGKDNKVAFDEIIRQVIEYVVNNKVTSSDLSDINSSKKKRFHKTLEIFINNLKTDWIYRISFEDHIYKLIIVVNSLMSDINYSSNLTGIERLIGQGLKQSALFEKDQDFSPHFKLNLTLILCRIIYLKIKNSPGIVKINSQPVNLSITEEIEVKNSILDEITAGKKINSQILKKFYKLLLEEFQTYFEKLQQKLNSDLIYLESFRDYISDLVRLVFNIVHSISKKSHLTQLELAVVKDLANYNFEWFNKKPERSYFYYLNLSQSNKIEILDMGKIHSDIINKLRHDFKQENNSKQLSISKLSNLVKGLSLTQFKKLKTTTKSLRYATYLEFYYFIKQAYENNNIEHEKWREMKKLFKILFETTTNNTKSLPSQYELENFLYPSYVEPIWELWNSLEWEQYQNSYVLLKRYWCRYCNHIAKILIEYCQKFTNIPFKVYILKDGETKWREIQGWSKIHNLDVSNLEKNLSKQLNIDLEKDIIEIRLLNKKYQYRYIIENSESFYNAKEFLSDITSNINNFIRNKLVKKNIELQIENNMERVSLIKGNKITQYSLSLLMEEDKEFIRKVIKQNLNYNEQYIINFACLKKLSKNIILIFEENESNIEEINNAVKKIQNIIKNYIEKNKRFFLAKNQIIIQNHPNIALNYFNKIFNEEISIVERKEAAYWLGFIYADGYITINARNKKSSNEFGINLSIQDKSQLIKFCLAIGANPTFIREVITSEKDGKSYFASIFRMYNENFCKILKNHGVVRKKSKIIELPEQFKTLKKNNDGLKMIFLSFLLGYYDGDGIVNRNTIISGSKKFLKQINNVLVNAFGANLKSKIDERTEGNYYLNIERKIKQYMENGFQNSLERKRRYAKGKYSENIDPLILKLIIQNLNELPISEMIKIYNDLIEKHCLPKYLKLSVNNLKRNIALNGYKNHHKEWYVNRNLNLRFNTNVFKKKLIELLEKIK